MACKWGHDTVEMYSLETDRCSEYVPNKLVHFDTLVKIDKTVLRKWRRFYLGRGGGGGGRIRPRRGLLFRDRGI